MKIELKQLQSFHVSLSIGQQYEVFTTCKNLLENLTYAVIINNENNPLLVNLQSFNIISSQIPRCWKVTVNSMYLSASPSDLLNADFWDDYFDDIDEANEKFIEEINCIIKKSNLYEK